MNSKPDSQLSASVTAIEWLRSLGPALPLSPIKTQGAFRRMSNSDLRRACEQSTVLINGEAVKYNELMDFPIFSLVFFPKSPKKRTTLF